ncbi:N-6 DNA methylase [Nocardiopsis sp. EMB25]|uniref:Eco57I restriction-modification methylase domain-containing protein n=1 Tax=Nocardiopsis sp. EMB25 TaxID=2835867 RepID=UPI0022852E12|nr:N-6 DNA methylase [Nocardiopsis sp. EMB25]MCY9784193.1 N-6 DNA methylase [Nocardiopsis sp. EMB25]
MSATGHALPPSAVRTVGSLLPGDMLLRVSEGRGLSGCHPADYGAVGARSVSDEAERHWNYLLNAWSDLRERLPVTREGEPSPDPMGVAVAHWLGPLFDELGYGRLPALRIRGITADDEPGRTIPITHRWQHTPIHITAWDSDLDRSRRSGGAFGQALVQEALNRTSDHLWGIATNGRRVRLLRDSSSLAGPSYVEFDVQTIFDGELFNEFVLLFRVLHATSFEVGEGEPASACRLERWRTEALHSEVQALDALRDNVERALTALGTGFLRHPANTDLRAGADARALHGALLRFVFRLLFLVVTEDRGLLHHPDADQRARQRYADYFSTDRLRRLASRGGGGPHGDLYEALRIVLDALGEANGRTELGLIGLGGLFTQTEEDRPLAGAKLSNAALLTAVRHLARVWDPAAGRWRAVDYRSLGSRELGSVYESLLETVPQCDEADRSFRLVPRAGNERKRTGAYYTPSSLVERLLDATLEPVLDDAVKQAETGPEAGGGSDPAEAVIRKLLSVTVCDPACGSGHFLVAAAHRIARRVAALREGTPEPTEKALQEAMHEAVARCVYGVDLNPMAVNLAKVSLWLEGMAPGKPLDLLDPHIKQGNALIGASPGWLRAKEGIPDSAFVPVEGDDKGVASALARRNAWERAGQGELLPARSAALVANTEFALEVHEIYQIRVGELRDVREQENVYREWRASGRYRQAVHLADAWCAAFMWEKVAEAPPPVTQEIFQDLRASGGHSVPAATHEEIVRLRERYGFFHWHLEFPDVFRVPSDGQGVDPDTGWDGGFDCVLTNPPWDKLDFEDKKYFSVVEPSIARISGVARRERITQWARDHPREGGQYRQARRYVKSSFLFASRSGAYPLCAKGLAVKGVNSFQVDQIFVERCTAITHRQGRIGVIAPSAIATGAGSQKLIRSLVRHGSVASLYDFENTRKIFRGVDGRQKFCLLSLAGEEKPEPTAELAFHLQDTAELDDRRRVFQLSPGEVRLLNPNTQTLPVFRSRRDADLTLSIYHRVPVLWNESERGGNRWNVMFKNLFNMTDDSGLFRTRVELEDEGWSLDGNVFVRDGQRMLPLLEGKMVHHFDHRWNTFTGAGPGCIRQLTNAEKQSQTEVAMPRYWVPEHDTRGDKIGRHGYPDVREGVATRLRALGWERGWLYGWRDVCRATDERTAIPALIPCTAVGHTFPLMLSLQEPRLIAALYAVQSSLVFDFTSRQKATGAHMALMTWRQLPVPAPADLEPHTGFLVPRVLELVYSTHDMAPFARDLGYDGPPFPWDEARRAALRAELDAYCLHLYGLERADAEYVLETFQTARGGLRNNEIARFGTYRTKELVLESFDRLTGVRIA